MLSHVCCKTSRNTHSGDLGIQRNSMRARQPEVAAVLSRPPALTADHRWLLFLEELALNPRMVRGRVKGVSKKPKNPIVREDERIQWIADTLGWPPRNVVMTLADAQRVLYLQSLSDWN